MSDPSPIVVKAVRYDVARWAVVQTTLPIAMLAGIASRRIPGPTTTAVAIGMLAVSAWLILRARRSFGKQTLTHADGKAILQESGEELSRRTTNRWTLRGRSASLYGTRVTFRIRLVKGDEATFQAVLSSVVGERTQTTRRGTLRARAIAAGFFVLGLALVAVSIAIDNLPLLMVGILVAFAGGGLHGALSQRVMRP